jgi:hypothetical protein
VEKSRGFIVILNRQKSRKTPDGRKKRPTDENYPENGFSITENGFLDVCVGKPTISHIIGFRARLAELL